MATRSENMNESRFQSVGKGFDQPAPIPPINTYSPNLASLSEDVLLDFFANIESNIICVQEIIADLSSMPHHKRPDDYTEQLTRALNNLIALVTFRSHMVMIPDGPGEKK